MKRPYGKNLISATFLGAALAISGLGMQAAQAEDTLMVRDFVLTHGVSEREPIDNTTTYKVEDGKVYAFARINNSGGPTSVNFVWLHGDEEHGSVPMSIGTSSGWRTWSSANLKAGNWRVKLVDANGQDLSEKSFVVGGQATTAQTDMNQEISTAVGDAPNIPVHEDLYDDGNDVSATTDTGIEDRSGL